jgi:hypothetical protein
MSRRWGAVWGVESEGRGTGRPWFSSQGNADDTIAT